MILGAVTDRLELRIPLRVLGPQGSAVATEAAIDTGYSEELALPHEMVDALGLAYLETRALTLADGTRAGMDVYECAVVWDGVERRVRAHCTGDTVLVGVALLIGYRVRFDVIHNGPVLVTELP